MLSVDPWVMVPWYVLSMVELLQGVLTIPRISTAIPINLDRPTWPRKELKLDVDYSCGLFAKSIKAVLDIEEVNNVILIGQSLGGVVCTTFIPICPTMVAGMIYVGAVLWPC